MYQPLYDAHLWCESRKPKGFAEPDFPADLISWEPGKLYVCAWTRPLKDWETITDRDDLWEKRGQQYASSRFRSSWVHTGEYYPKIASTRSRLSRDPALHHELWCYRHVDTRFG